MLISRRDEERKGDRHVLPIAIQALVDNSFKAVGATVENSTGIETPNRKTMQPAMCGLR
jgi:hypothetical protein